MERLKWVFLKSQQSNETQLMALFALRFAIFLSLHFEKCSRSLIYEAICGSKSVVFFFRLFIASALETCCDVLLLLWRTTIVAVSGRRACRPSSGWKF